MEKGLSSQKLAFLLTVTIEYIITSVISKEMSLTIAHKPKIQLALAIPPVALDTPSKRQPVRPSEKKKPKIAKKGEFSPIFTPEETLCSRTLASLKEGINYIECLYQVKKLRIRHKVRLPQMTLEPLLNI